jgi:iron complex outermembrane receptor protein
MSGKKYRKKYSMICLMIFGTGYLSIISNVQAQDQGQENPPPAIDLKKLSMEELMNVEIEVTSVSRHPEKLTEVASAIQVITREDIRRSAATNLPEALRLFPNLQVAQLNSYSWIISARGFNAVFSNKLLVMIDGRTVYSPLFAGVYWDAQSVLLEDVERIEVVSGPGGTLWGANAVNGVINIITREAKDTGGLYLSGALGDIFKNFIAARYGRKIGNNFSYRVFGQSTNRDNTFQDNGQEKGDKWNFTQGGIRTDWTLSEKNTLSMQGNLYQGTERTTPGPSTLDGQNVLARWTHTFSDTSNLIVQAYIDRTWRRDLPSTISDELLTYDIDFQHGFHVFKRHNILWGGGYRLMQDRSQHSTIYVGFLPENKAMPLLNGFVQDEITVVPERFKITIGTKLLHNVYTGFEIQPSIRMAWIPDATQTIWGAVSRAVRTPSRIDVDYYLPTYPVASNVPHVAGGPNFVSEKVIAYELGYRMQPIDKLSMSLATFYNQYNDIYSVEPLPGTLIYEIQNGLKGRSYGAELSGTFQATPKWRIRGGYTYFLKNIENKPGHSFNPFETGHDAKHLVILQSVMNLPFNFQMDVTGRYVGAIDNFTKEYYTFDARLAWVWNKFEFSVSGQNLWKKRHHEYSSQIPRSTYAKITCRF